MRWQLAVIGIATVVLSLAAVSCEKRSASEQKRTIDSAEQDSSPEGNERRRTSDWLTVEALRSTFGEHMQLMEQAAKDPSILESRYPVYRASAETKALFTQYESILEASVELPSRHIAERWVSVVIHRRPTYDLVRFQSPGMPYRSDGSLTPILVGTTTLASGEKLKTVLFQWAAEAADDGKVECKIVFDHRLLMHRLTGDSTNNIED